ncbi:SacI domain protein [Aspergillus clavatus NRRL 1]|uniref:SacI domain protein n=1 Tax=Aspergillus clavatus (strain ATCC 1007 / CBS 513.65 / DSM 816 / NCTC 3887 / NRRL 1 / QM 1276 / 107) TaxID=344612 RepID=A1CNM1_ASPCL|nr:SacI domain protein [Aspergillus clavatus NRRL 1]EAW07242.1 SacI domain protein [Aspergillus clavatus NRRL 1]
MPGLLRKLVIFAAVDGLILQSHGNGGRFGGNNEPQALRIDYKTNKISPLSASASDTAGRNEAGLDVYGLVGLLSVASYSFLISITQRQQVAQIQGKPVYTITNVAIIPLSSQTDASQAIAQARENALQDDAGQGETASEGSISDTETDNEETDVVSVPGSPTQETPPPRNRSGSIAEEVIGKRLRFGRFAASWLSRKTLGLPGLSNVGHDTAEILLGKENDLGTELHSLSDVQRTIAPDAVAEDSAESLVEDEKQPPSVNSSVDLLPKLLRYTKLIYSSQNFFFAYDYDLTRSISAQEMRNGHLPLHRVVDEMYFWNKNLMSPFIEMDAHSFILPLMQGFVGQREFTVAARTENRQSETDQATEQHTEGQILGDKQEAQGIDVDAEKRNYLLTLISRRSIKRPGLRYLRRGVDDEGNTANTVETEQILSVPDWDPAHNVYSYLQIRGSIPLYFSQSPYAFKPVPVLHHSTDTNQLAFDRHFRNLARRYGKIQAVSLIDKQAGELKLGEQYDKYAQALNESGGIEGSPLGMEWFDFHNECRGMKFENVSRLVKRLEPVLDDYRDTIVQNHSVLQNQTGIVRTNCMDCLDRTGVAQCAFGQWALERELKHEGIDIDLGGDSSTQWFNTLWADNGDAISKQYSSTAALKGDYTRTRKRDYRGALNDFGLTLSRYYNNIVNDYFSQACIDYLLGNVSTQVFQEFAMEMQTADPGISVQKLRQNAIDTSYRIVISDQSEDFLGGWAMLTPRQPNTLRTLPFEEAVLLLTDAAVYSCRFDWNIDKVISFERIDLRSISRLNYGTYITSILTESQADEQSNVGLVIEYREGGENALRVNTRSLRSQVDTTTLDSNAQASGEWDMYSWFRGSKQSTTRFIAFKALPLSNSVTRNKAAASVTVSEIDWVRSICEEIERAMMAGDGRPSADGKPPSVIENSEIISLEDAKKRTGILEHLVYDIKKLVWA